MFYFAPQYEDYALRSTGYDRKTLKSLFFFKYNSMYQPIDDTLQNLWFIKCIKKNI